MFFLSREKTVEKLPTRVKERPLLNSPANGSQWYALAGGRHPNTLVAVDLLGRGAFLQPL